jgi:cytochrome c-type biogenesis protein CcsB
LEWIYQRHPFFEYAASFYALGLVLLSIAGWRKWEWLTRTGVGAAVLGVLCQLTGIALRIYIGGRPPVTNMYESIVWVSFAVTVFGLAFYAIYRATLYLMSALPLSSLFLFAVIQLPIAMPASIDPLVPVLRSNLWLTIHVLTITMSYAAFALGMGFGHILLFKYIVNPRKTLTDHQLHFWLYRVLQLGVLLLAAGTILGGVWANYSWGRFWGWDPKETWALIALLCYIVVIHGRFAGWWNQFGLAVGSVICFLAVIMAWYGVNFVLGKGLHSYGFGLGGESYVATGLAIDAAYVAFAIWRKQTAGMLPSPATTLAA